MTRLLALSLMLVASITAEAQNAAPIRPLPIPRIQVPLRSQPMNETMPGYVLVKLRPTMAANLQVAATAGVARPPFILPGAAYSKRIATSGWTLWKIPTTTDPKTAAASLKGQPTVLAAQPLNRIYPMMPTPTDPDWAVEETEGNFVLILTEGTTASFRRLWHLTDTNAEAAWDVYPAKWLTAATKPADGPLIAFVDTGCDMDHPDFINDGGTGTDVSQGGQFVKSLCAQFHLGSVLSGGDPNDTNGHGTHVTGLALAAGNNGGYLSQDGNMHGVIGTGFNCRGFICRVFDDSGNGTDADAAAAIYYAVDNGADIINLSLGTTNYSQLFQDATTYAWQKGVLVVAAGNENGNGGGDLGPIYPAACSGALAVSANGPNGQPATTSYSGYGPYVDIAAPGGDIVQSTDYFMLQYVFSTACRNSCALSQNTNMYPPYTLDYTYLIGTSMATPIVSGAAGLYYGAHGLKRSDGWANIRAYRWIEKSAAGVMGAPYGGWEQYQGYGCLDMWSLLTEYDARTAEVGGAEGIVYYNGTPTQNVAVKAQSVSGGLTYSTTTRSDGMYRFEGMPQGVYKVWASPFGATKTKKVVIDNGDDLSGFDFWCGTYAGDETPPTIARFNAANVATDTVTLNLWALDTETGVDQLTIRLGTKQGAADVMRTTEFVPSGSQVTLTGLHLTPGVTYFATAQAVNGAGLTSTAYAKVMAKAAPFDASFVSQTVPATLTHSTTATVRLTFKNTGTRYWDPISTTRVALCSQNPTYNTIWGMNLVRLPSSTQIPPGGKASFTFSIKAPATPGTYNFQWQMRQANGTFFGTPSTNVAVVVN